MGRPTPEQVAKGGSEHAIQTALFVWANNNVQTYPELRWLFAIPNGGLRSKVQGAKLKAEGVKSGVSDLCLPVARLGYHGLFIEMKRPKKKPSDEQKEFSSFVLTQGYLWVLSESWQHARDCIVYYLTHSPEILNHGQS